MLTQDGIEAWLADANGVEIEHGPVTQASDKPKDTATVVYVEPGKVCTTFAVRFSFSTLKYSFPHRKEVFCTLEASSWIRTSVLLERSINILPYTSEPNIYQTCYPLDGQK